MINVHRPGFRNSLISSQMMKKSFHAATQIGYYRVALSILDFVRIGTALNSFVDYNKNFSIFFDILQLLFEQLRVK